MGRIDYVLIIGSVGNFISVGIFAYFVYLSNWRRALAHQGDLSSAGRILLPCYRPIFRWMVFVYAVLGTGMALSLLSGDSIEVQFYVLQLYSLILLTTFVIAPLLLLQSSISYNAIRNCAIYIIPWFILCVVLWAVSHPYHRVPGWKQTLISFWVFTSAPPILLGLALSSRAVSSRILVSSCQYRAALDHMLAYAIMFVVTSGVASTPLFKGHGECQEMLDICSVIAGISFFWNQVFPWALYRTLLADTKYWRGLGKHNDGFTAEIENKKTGSITVSSIFKPDVMDIRLVTHDLQSAMADMHSIVVDFALLNIKKRIGEGAHAHVYSGILRQEPVAVKVFVPTEVNQEVIREFLREAKLSQNIKHKNVVSFAGVCVRPPQIAMVMEFCEGGNLKTNIHNNKDQWTGLMRANACFDAAMAVEYLHKSGYIHRDIKAENFLVAFPLERRDSDIDSSSSNDSQSKGTTRRSSLTSTSFGRRSSFLKRELPSKDNMGRIRDDFIVKLGDFGESCKQRVREDGSISNVRNSLVLRPIARGDSWRDGTEELFGDFDEEGVGSMLESAPTRMSIKGTAGFMAPELVSAAKTYSEAVDIYALGVAFWEIWTGSDPYEGLSVFQVHEMVEKGDRPEIPPEIPEGMGRIINECWAQSASQRATASELLSMLEGFILEEYEVDNSYRYTYGEVDSSEITNRLSKGQSSTGLGIRAMTKNAVKNARRRSRGSFTGFSSSMRDSSSNDSDRHSTSSPGAASPVFKSQKLIDRVPSPSEGLKKSLDSLPEDQSSFDLQDSSISPIHIKESLETDITDEDREDSSEIDSTEYAQEGSGSPRLSRISISGRQKPLLYPSEVTNTETDIEVVQMGERDKGVNEDVYAHVEARAEAEAEVEERVPNNHSKGGSKESNPNGAAPEKRDGDDIIRNSTLANAGALVGKTRRGSLQSVVAGKHSESGIRKGQREKRETRTSM